MADTGLNPAGSAPGLSDVTDVAGPPATVDGGAAEVDVVSAAEVVVDSDPLECPPDTHDASNVPAATAAPHRTPTARTMTHSLPPAAEVYDAAVLEP